MKEESQIKRVAGLISNYKSETPFAIYLKDHFRLNPQMGARDRRETKEWCYNLLRIGKNLEDISPEKRLAAANFLCSSDLYPSLEYLLKNHSPFEPDFIKLTLKQKISKIKMAYPTFEVDNIFPLHNLLSPQVEKKDWVLSMLKQPLVFLRVKKDKKTEVQAELKKVKIS